jgi:hypothetical protein
LNQLDLVSFWRIDKRDYAPAAGRRWAIGKRITFGGGVFRESIEIIYFKREVCDIATHFDWAASIELTNLDFFLTPRRFKENKLRASGRFMSSNFF